MHLSSVLDKRPVASKNARVAPRATVTDTTRGEWRSSPRPGVSTKPMQRAWAVRSGSEQRRWMLTAVSGIDERQRRAVDAAVSDARVCLHQYLGQAGREVRLEALPLPLAAGALPPSCCWGGGVRWVGSGGGAGGSIRRRK
jgi:hypothetical protein